MSKTYAIGEINCIKNFYKQFNEECKLLSIGSTEYNPEVTTSTNCKVLDTIINTFNDPTEIDRSSKPSKYNITLNESSESTSNNNVVNNKKCELKDIAEAIHVTPTIQDFLKICDGNVKFQALSKASISRSTSPISGERIGIPAAVDERKYTPFVDAQKGTKAVIEERSVTATVVERSRTISVNDRIKAADDKHGSAGERSGADDEECEASDEGTETAGEREEVADGRTEPAGERKEAPEEETEIAGTEATDKRTKSAAERTKTINERAKTAEERTKTNNEGAKTIDERTKTIDERTKTIDERSKIINKTTKTIGERTETFDTRNAAVDQRGAAVDASSAEVIETGALNFRRGKIELYNLSTRICKEKNDKTSRFHSSKLKLNANVDFKTDFKYISDLVKFIETINLTNSDMVKKSYKLLLKQNLVSEMLSYILASQSICRLSSPINIFLHDITREGNPSFDFSSKNNFHSAGECILEELQLYLSDLKADFEDWESKRVAILNISEGILSQFELCNSEHSARILMHNISTKICNILQDMNDIKSKRDERNVEFTDILEGIDRYIRFSSCFVRDKCPFSASL